MGGGNKTLKAFTFKVKEASSLLFSFFSVKMGDNITGLSVNSNGDSGWQYGYLRADIFGKELEKIVEPNL